MACLNQVEAFSPNFKNLSPAVQKIMRGHNFGFFNKIKQHAIEQAPKIKPVKVK